MEIDIHNVTRIELNGRKDHINANGQFYTRKIYITGENGTQFHITMYADDEKSLSFAGEIAVAELRNDTNTLINLLGRAYAMLAAMNNEDAESLAAKIHIAIGDINKRNFFGNNIFI